FCIVVIIVLSACFTTSNTLSPVFSVGVPFAVSPGMGASLPIEPETSITQHMSNGVRFPGFLEDISSGLIGGVTDIKTCLALASAERAALGTCVRGCRCQSSGGGQRIGGLVSYGTFFFFD